MRQLAGGCACAIRILVLQREISPMRATRLQRMSAVTASFEGCYISAAAYNQEHCQCREDVESRAGPDRGRARLSSDPETRSALTAPGCLVDNLICRDARNVAGRTAALIMDTEYALFMAWYVEYGGGGHWRIPERLLVPTCEPVANVTAL